MYTIIGMMILRIVSIILEFEGAERQLTRHCARCCAYLCFFAATQSMDIHDGALGLLDVAQPAPGPTDAEHEDVMERLSLLDVAQPTPGPTDAEHEDVMERLSLLDVAQPAPGPTDAEHEDVMERLSLLDVAQPTPGPTDAEHEDVMERLSLLDVAQPAPGPTDAEHEDVMERLSLLDVVDDGVEDEGEDDYLIASSNVLGIMQDRGEGQEDVGSPCEYAVSSGFPAGASHTDIQQMLPRLRSLVTGNCGMLSSNTSPRRQQVSHVCGAYSQILYD
jgi:hypothetical protein